MASTDALLGRRLTAADFPGSETVSATTYARYPSSNDVFVAAQVPKQDQKKAAKKVKKKKKKTRPAAAHENQGIMARDLLVADWNV